MYKLYGAPTNRGGRVIWALEELGAEYEIVNVKAHSSEVDAVNPVGKIPVLLDGDLAVSDSTAILFHLADKHDALTFPVGTAERSRLTSLAFFLVDDLEGPLWTVTKHMFMLPEDLRAPDAVRPACVHDYANALKALERHLGDGPWLMGEPFTIADIIVGHLAGWAKAMGFPDPEGAVADYVNRVRARPAALKLAELRRAAAA